MSRGSKHKPAGVEELHRLTNIEPTHEIPAPSKSTGVLWFWLGVERFYHTAYWVMFLPKCKTKPICRAKGLEQEKTIFLCSQGPVYNHQWHHWKLKQESTVYKMQHLRDSAGGVITFLNGCCSTVVNKASGMPNKVSTIANATQLYLLLSRWLKN